MSEWNDKPTICKPTQEDLERWKESICKPTLQPNVIMVGNRLLTTSDYEKELERKKKMAFKLIDGGNKTKVKEFDGKFVNDGSDPFDPNNETDKTDEGKVPVYSTPIEDNHRIQLPFINIFPLPEGCYLAGGSCIKLLDRYHTFNDYDIFFLNGEKYSGLLDDYAMHLKSKRFGFRKQQTTNFTESFYHPSYGRIQLVKQTFDNIQDILNSFDLNIVQVATDGKDIFYTKQALLGIENKEVKINTVSRAIWTMKRLMKYGSKGYNIRSECYGKLVSYLRSLTDEQIQHMTDYNFHDQW